MKNFSVKKVRIACVAAMLLLCSLFAAGCGNGTKESAPVRVGAMKGPTTIGLLELMKAAENGTADNDYTFTMATGADELTPLMVKGELDIALVPANVAAVLYNKTEGGISVIDVNTLGVLYMISGNPDITGFADLKGQTIYLTGKGTTPDYVLQYLLAQNGISTEEVNLEYRSEATEVAALLAENPGGIGLLPQPFVTVACGQNEQLSICLSMTEEWEKVQGEDGSSLLTGVTVVRKEFLQENPEAVEIFLMEQAQSTAYVETHLDETAVRCVEAGIIAKEPIAKKAIPFCNITCLTGEEMKQALSGYLNVLYGFDAQTVGGKLPGDDFYYIGNQ